MHECSLWTNILGSAFDDDMRTAWLIPLRFYLETGEITWAGAVVCFYLPSHLGGPPLKDKSDLLEFVVGAALRGRPWLQSCGIRRGGHGGPPLQRILALFFLGSQFLQHRKIFEGRDVA